MAPQKASRLTRDNIDASKLLKSVGDDGAGATVLFLGVVRDNSDAGGVESMVYEAYEPMAEKSLAETEEEVKRRWPATKAVKIVHRVGTLAVGDVSVAVAVSSPHRADAFDACRFAIETIKHDVPIWKRERLRGGKEVWAEGVPLRSGTGVRGGSVSKRVAGRAAGTGDAEPEGGAS